MRNLKWLSVMSICLLGTPVMAHVPYVEREDFSQEMPFVVPFSIQQSIAVYSWVEFDGSGPAEDVDVYSFEVDDPVEVFLEALVPVCPGYDDFYVWFALAGPGLPPPDVEVPFQLPDGYGAIVMTDGPQGEPREMFYEPFGGKAYYQGPRFTQTMTEPGQYLVYYWDPDLMGGDYVAVLGEQEIWRVADILRAVVVTPLIRQDRELHVSCPR